MEYLLHWQKQKNRRSFEISTCFSEKNIWTCTLTIIDENFIKKYKSNASLFGKKSYMNNLKTVQDIALSMFCTDIFTCKSKNRRNRKNKIVKKEILHKRHINEPLYPPREIVMEDSGLDDVIIKNRSVKSENNYHKFLDRQLEEYFKKEETKEFIER